MFWRIIRKTLIRQWKKMAMIAITVTLGVSLATAMINVMLGIGDKVNRELKTYGANINVVPKNASLLNDLYGLNEGEGINDSFLKEEDVTKVKQIFWGYNVVDFAPYLRALITVDGISRPVKSVGTWFDKYLELSTGEKLNTGMISLKNWWEIEGEWITEKDIDYVLVGKLLSNRNNIKIGDTLHVNYGNKQKELKVKGIFNAGGEEDNELYMNLDTLQEITGTEGKVNQIEVSALTTPDNELSRRAAQDPKSLTLDEYETWYCTAYVSAICYQIQEVIPDAVAKAIRQVAESEGTILNKTQLLMTLITILGSIGAALGISNLVTATVMERSREIGLLKAIGAQNTAIALLILVEVLITGIIGGIFGYIVGLGFAQVIGLTVFNSYIEPAIIVIPIVTVVMLLVIVVGSIPAIRYLLALKPTEVLHGK